MDKLNKLGRGAREQRKKGKHTKGNQQAPDSSKLEGGGCGREEEEK